MLHIKHYLYFLSGGGVCFGYLAFGNITYGEFKKEPILFVNCDGEFNETKAGPCFGSNPSQCLLFVCSVNSEINLKQ